MNYMLIENTTLSSMKQTNSSYEKIDVIDPSPSDSKRAHRLNITCMIIIHPEDLMHESTYAANNTSQKKEMSVSQYKKKVKFVTGDKDGCVKVWTGMGLKMEVSFQVSKWSVTALCFMSGSKRLAVATTDRMISFYALDTSTKKSTEPPKSRIEDLPAVPLCLEYVKHPQQGMDAKKTGEEAKPLERLLWGDDLGIITMYNFTDTNWHICKFKKYAKQDRNYLRCHEDEIANDYYWRQWNNDNLKETYQTWQSLPKLMKDGGGRIIDDGNAEPEGAGAAAGQGASGQAGKASKGKKGKKGSQLEESKNGNKMLNEESKI